MTERRRVPADRPLDAIRVALASIAPAGVDVGARRIDALDIARLHPDESAMVRDAVAKRRREFATGRRLLRELVGGAEPILPGANRAPTFVAGVRGSLAHDDVFAVAAISRVPAIIALGIDIEPITPLAADIAAMILRPDEAGIDAHLGFTLKEAAYKAWSTTGGRILDHHEMAIAVHGDAFRAMVVPDGRVFEGHFVMAAGRWLALVATSTARGRVSSASG